MTLVHDHPGSTDHGIAGPGPSDLGVGPGLNAAAATSPDAPGTPDCWGEDDRVDLVCRQVLDITHDVKTFWFEPVGPQVFHFDPGQFITLHLEIDPTSHPAWTGGRGQMLDTGGQVARFNKRFGGLSLGKK